MSSYSRLNYENLRSRAEVDSFKLLITSLAGISFNLFIYKSIYTSFNSLRYKLGHLIKS